MNPHVPVVRRPRPVAAVALSIVAALSVVLLSACGDIGGGGSTGPTVYKTVTPTVTYTPPPAATTSATTPAPTPPQTYAEAVAHLATATSDAAAAQGFVSPSGNIYCTIYAGSTTRGCELKTGRIGPPTSDYCASGGGAKDIGRVVFGPNGPVAQCNTDTIARADAPKLNYGASTRSGDLSCVSEVIGVTCLNASTNHGFFLARDKFFIF